MTIKGKLILGGVAVVALGVVFIWGSGLGGDLASLAITRRTRDTMPAATRPVPPTSIATAPVIPSADGFGYGPPTPRLFQGVSPIYYAKQDPSGERIFRLNLSTLVPSTNNVVFKSRTGPVYAYCGINDSTKIAECIFVTAKNDPTCVDWQIIAESGYILDTTNLHICPSRPLTTSCDCSCSGNVSMCTQHGQEIQKIFNENADKLTEMIKNKDPKTKEELDKMANALDPKLDDQDVGNLAGALLEAMRQQSLVITPDTPMGNICTNKELQEFRFAISSLKSNLDSLKKLCKEGGSCIMDSIVFYHGEALDAINRALKLVNAKLTDPNITLRQKEALLEVRRKIYDVQKEVMNVQQGCTEATLKTLDAQMDALLAASTAAVLTVVTVGVCAPILGGTIAASGYTTLALAAQGAALAGTTMYDVKVLSPLISSYERSKNQEGITCDNFWKDFTATTDSATRKELIKAGLYETALIGVGGGALKIPGLLRNGFLGAKYSCHAWTSVRTLNGVRSVGIWETNSVWIEEKVIARLVNGEWVPVLENICR